MHNDFITIKSIINIDNVWYANAVSDSGEDFTFPVADGRVSLKTINENGIFAGRRKLVVIHNGSLANSGFKYIDKSYEATADCELGD